MLWAAPLVLLLSTLQPPDCATLVECREQAEVARAAGKFERFHDLAWRTVQKGKANDPELMLLLARAQSLSGRPHDALVMLRRLAGLGVRAEEAKTDDDFRRVRALAGWADLEAIWSAIPEDAAAAPEPPAAAPEPPKPTAEPPVVVEAPKVVKATKANAKPEAAPPAPKPEPPVEAPKPAAVRRGSETLRFQGGVFTPSGLTYDAVSRRFIIGDLTGRRLSVVDEFSHGITTLASERGAGFGEVTGLTIDARDGTLWVVSNREDGSRLHKLQLISARELAHYDAPEPIDGSRFADVVLDPRGGVLVLDTGAKRVLRLPPAASNLRVVGALPADEAASMAPSPDGRVYVAHADGIARMNLANGESIDITAADKLSLAGLTRLRWHNGALVGIQADKSGSGRAVRLQLARNGRSVTAIEILDEGIERVSAGALAVTGDTLYYLAVREETTVIREVVLK